MKKIFTLMMMATLMASPVMAQEEVDPSTITEQSVTGLRHYKFGDNWYISAFFGGNFSMSENSRFQGFKKNVGPDYALAIGKWLNPAIGLRVKADYMIQSSRANNEAIAARYHAEPEQHSGPVQRKHSLQCLCIHGSRFCTQLQV